MLRDAAVLQLDLLLAALDEGMSLKDASAYNIQWKGSAPVFVDIASFYKRTPVSRGSATGSSARCFSILCCFRHIVTCHFSPGSAAASMEWTPRSVCAC